MAEREAERLAVVENEIKHIREAQEEATQIAKEELAIMQGELRNMRNDVQKLTDVLTKMSGVKIAFTILGMVLAAAATQFWNFIHWRGN